MAIFQSTLLQVDISLCSYQRYVHNKCNSVILNHLLEVKINFEFKKGVGIAIKSKETNS